jgi:RNA polymerase sigma factor (TIGR02999 family)
MLLEPAAHHQPDPAADAQVTQGLYDELRRIAWQAFSSERSDHTLQPTAAVNEACLRLMSTSKLPDLPREEQLAIAGRVLRQVLIDHSRSRGAEKRGGGAMRIQLDHDIAGSSPTIIDIDAIHGALERLRALHERQAEVISLRIFSGLAMDQVASVLGVSKRTVEDDWTVARAWLRRELSR